MNHTHYALFNEDGDIFAIVKRDGFPNNVIKAVQDETTDEVLDLQSSSSACNIYGEVFKMDAKLNHSNLSFKIKAVPTWEY